jgi:ring-1,2-phenylacetyl-CoA epoxidase subunit PaaD
VVTSTRSISESEVRASVAAVLDPELPMITIEDLGILRDVRLATDDEHRDVVHVDITPTYAGCPAMDAIRADIEAALPGHRVVVHTVLAPAWSTDDLTAGGRAKLSAAGIAPPGSGPVGVALTVRCPQCGSPDTRELSRFGSTACKALWVCNACAEPFDRFKEH